MGEIAKQGSQVSLTLAEKITEAADKLAPASGDAIAARLLGLKNSGLSFPPGLDPKRAPEIYAAAMKGIPLEALKRASVRILRGEVPNVSKDFIPTPPNFAAIARKEAVILWEDYGRLKLTADSMRPVERRNPSPEERSRVRQMVEQVKAEAEAIKLAEDGPPKTEAELNRMFRNKVPPPPDVPQVEKWSDEDWHAQQREMENGQENFGNQDQGNGFVPGGSEGQQDGSGGGGEG